MQLYIWSLDQFKDRYYRIQDLMDKYIYTKSMPILKKKYDPFCDAFKPHVIGHVYVSLKHLFKTYRLNQELTIIGNYGPTGFLQIFVGLFSDQNDVPTFFDI